MVIHCGDFTQHSKLSEIITALELLDGIDAGLKLIIPGNHDFSFDTPIFREKIKEAQRLGNIEDDLVQAEYGGRNDATELFRQAKQRGIHLLEEGTHHFKLENGAGLKVYASPYTPCPPGEEPTWGFQYHNNHTFDIEEGTDVAITHGPPHGIFDMSNQIRIGCPDLFGAVAKAKPKVHCFGHVHGGWGAKAAMWRERISQRPSHFSDIDHGKSSTIRTLTSLKRESRKKTDQFCLTQYSQTDLGKKTLFINAAVQGEHGGELDQLPWVVDVDLQRPGVDASSNNEGNVDNASKKSIKRSSSTVSEAEEHGQPKRLKNRDQTPKEIARTSSS